MNSPADQLNSSLQLLVGLTDTERGALRGVLSSCRPKSELADQIVRELPSLRSDEAFDLVDALVIYSISSPESLVTLGVTEEQFARLEDLITAPAIERLAYAANLAFETERQFVAGRVVTDIRPIFSHADDGDPRLTSNVLVMNTLSIDYTGGGADGSFWVSMTAADLVELQSTIERALKKLDVLAESMPWGSVDLSDGK